MSHGYIYKTTNMANGKVYIGQHKGLFSHSYLGSGIVISKAIHKYGKDTFKVEPISYAETKQELDRLERFYIDELRKTLLASMIYNIADGGEGGNTFKDTDEDRLRMKIIASKRKRVWNKGLNKNNSEAVMRIAISKIGKTAHNKGIPMSQEQKNKLSAISKGIQRSPKTQFKKGMIGTNLGKKFSVETRKKISEAKRARDLARKLFKGDLTTV